LRKGGGGMSCYFRHIGEIFAEAGVEVTKENKKALDAAIHKAVGVACKDCPSAWRAVKALLAKPGGRARLVRAVKGM
jgi:hypothetical protein